MSKLPNIQRVYNKGARSWLGRFSFTNSPKDCEPESDFAKRWAETFHTPDPDFKLSDETRLDYRGQRLRRVVKVKPNG